MPDPTPQWLMLIPRRDLNVIHHALRMFATHPSTTELTGLREVERLADVVWDAGVRRSRLLDKSVT